MQIVEKFKDFLVSEKQLARFFWATSAFAFLLNLLDFLPSTRRPLFSDLISIFLSNDNAVYESLQLPILLWLIWVLWSKALNPRLKDYPFFRWGTLALVILIFFEEISWGAVFIGNEHYQWMVPYAKGVDFHNYDLRDTDASELIEAVVGIGICLFLIPQKSLRGLKRRLGIPEFAFSTFQYAMLIFANFTGLWALFHPSGKHDVFYENMTFFTLLICVLRYNGKLRDPVPSPEGDWPRAFAYVTTLVMPLKFYILYEYGYLRP